MSTSIAKAAGRRFDTLVVGAGAAGCVVARRLAEDPDRQVLLLEAGADHPLEPAVLAAVRNANQVAVAGGANWHYAVQIKSEAAVRGPAGTFNYLAGRLVGGSSAVNAVQALRGRPADFDAWAETCGDEWRWSHVLPYFRALEDDPIGPERLHGRGGPMPIRREPLETLTPLQSALMAACLAQGHAATPDHNDPAAAGVGVIPKNVLDGVRVSTADAYLAPVRSAPNLTIVARATVHRLHWRSGSACEGVDAEVDGAVQRFLADRVILCAGAIGTPAILMRSGVGDAEHLRSKDVSVRLPLRGVGENLMDHPVVGIWGVPREGMCRLGEPLRQTLLRSTSMPGRGENDIDISLMAGMDAAQVFPHLLGAGETRPIAGVTACFNRSVSRGRVRLASARPEERPLAWLNCLGDERDLAPLAEGVRTAWRLLQQPELRSSFQQVLAWTDSMIGSDRALHQALRSFVRPAAHLGGSARMGAAPDDGDVVDPTGRVHGADNLWVADASVMPCIPSAPPHLTCLMVAEKIAARLRERRT